jgi:hypothetical protein
MGGSKSAVSLCRREKRKDPQAYARVYRSAVVEEPITHSITLRLEPWRNPALPLTPSPGTLGSFWFSG